MPFYDVQPTSTTPRVEYFIQPTIHPLAITFPDRDSGHIVRMKSWTSKGSMVLATARPEQLSIDTVKKGRVREHEVRATDPAKYVLFGTEDFWIEITRGTDGTTFIIQKHEGKTKKVKVIIW